ncbi:MAG: DUF4936 family protein [Rubrivivax sp.]|nr:MAG: DUF4936 family protein [Rubrivivax sp.]
MNASPPTRAAAPPIHPASRPAAPVELYVYYRVHADQLKAALAAFEQARQAQPVRLLQRHDNDPVFQTWMEIYGPELPDAADAERRIAAALGAFAQGPRHREAFAAVAGPGAVH